MSAAARNPVLVVDDDPKIVTLVRTYLEREGFRVTTAGDGRAALAAIEAGPPRLVVLDLMIPELDGYAVMQRVRQASSIPIVVLSARGSAADRVHGISEGADDYLAKPFSPAELVVRVKAVLRRAEAGDTRDRGTHELQDLVIDLDRMEVRRGDEILGLTPTELRLLSALAAARGRVLTRGALLDALHGPGLGDVFERTIDVHVRRLREKLGDNPSKPRYIETVRGGGYRARCT